jgi:hypothetical protein
MTFAVVTAVPEGFREPPAPCEAGRLIADEGFVQDPGYGSLAFEVLDPGLAANEAEEAGHEEAGHEEAEPDAQCRPRVLGRSRR